MRIIRTPARRTGQRQTSARRSIYTRLGALAGGAFLGLVLVGAAVAASSPVPPTPPSITAPTPPTITLPTLPTPPTITAPTPPTITAPTPPLLVAPTPPLPISGNTVANGVGESLNVSGQVSAIQQEVDQLLAGGWSGQGGQLANPSCDYPQATQAFLPWGDNSYYSLAPDGDFSTSGEWTLNPQATDVSGADPYSGAQNSLQLASAGQAVTPAMCVNVNDPTIRFFVRDLNGNGSADVRVGVLFQGRSGAIDDLTIGWVRAGSSWQPSSIVPILVNQLAAASPSGETAVAFVFTAEGLAQNESIGVSSLYVDPFQSV